MGAAVLNKHVNPTLVIAHARAWVGTPFERRAALRGAGADCIGLVRGIWAELSGITAPTPPWRPNWASDGSDPIFAGLTAYADRVPLKSAAPGHIVIHRIGPARSAHVAVMTEKGGIHAWEVGGVKETTPLYGRAITSAWALPCHPTCTTGRTDLKIDECLAVIYPRAGDYFAEITDLFDGTALARTASFPTVDAALSTLDPIYQNIETMR